MAHSNRRVAEVRAQRESRKQAEAAGTNGRQEHKGKAPSSNKGRGGKMAR